MGQHENLNFETCLQSSGRLKEASRQNMYSSFKRYLGVSQMLLTCIIHSFLLEY